MTNLKKYSKVLKLTFLLLICSGISYSQSWTEVKGVNSYVNKIIFLNNNQNNILVCSDGVPTDFRQAHIDFPNFGFGNTGYQISTNGGTSFGEKILNGYSVYDVMPLSKMPNTWIASVRKSSRGAIIASTDAGVNWLTDLKGCDESWQIVSLFEDTKNSAVYGTAVNTSEGLRFTKDNFTTCDFIKNLDVSTRSIAVSSDGKTMFVGCDDSYNNGVMRSYDNGKTWIKDSSGLAKLRVLCVYPSKYDPAVVFAGADSLDSYRESIGKGIYQSLDTGKTWKKVGADGARIFQISQHPTNPKYLAAAGDSTGVWISGSYGWEWENYSTGLPIPATPIRNVAVSPEPANASGIIVFAGTYGAGMYKSSRLITSVENQNMGEISIYPNPANDFIQISISNEKSNLNIQNEIQLLNQLGEIIKPNISSNEKSIRIDISNLASGVYFIKIGDKIQKIVKI